MGLSDSIRIVRIFIGSPGGLEEERRATREIIQEVNQAHSEHWGCQLKLVGWEDTIPGYQRPQSLINVDLDKCQYFIGVLWNRWGTKPDLEASAFTSGFEEEFCRAKDLTAAGSMKDIALYFKAVNVPDGLEPGLEFQKVKDFRKQCIDEKRIFLRILRKRPIFVISFAVRSTKSGGTNLTNMRCPDHLKAKQSNLLRKMRVRYRQRIRSSSIRRLLNFCQQYRYAPAKTNRPAPMKSPDFG
ncbi:MAG: DUF4062 domain-containing protein [Parasphingorhabdus sp.]|uniref:DUF4062 domain-containing protein n=1 Tax=Parasphingorhabdus sp. TaxID=2709688 RepID=UPI003002DBD2